jgi:hypothetical protein
VVVVCGLYGEGMSVFGRRIAVEVSEWMKKGKKAVTGQRLVVLYSDHSRIALAAFHYSKRSVEAESQQ